jgi:hypothetical protein
MPATAEDSHVLGAHTGERAYHFLSRKAAQGQQDLAGI